MVKIRLMRVGKKKQPSFRVVVADSRSPRDGRIIEAIGHYQPRLEPSEISIDTDRAVHWLERGAQPSDQVRKLLEISGAWAAFTGEAPPTPSEPKKATVAASAKKATPAASVSEEPDAGSDEAEEVPAEAEAEAEAPEAQAGDGDAPEADAEAEETT